MTSSEGGALSALQIHNHGRDRYPTPKAQAEKAMIEAAELLGAIAQHEQFLCERGGTGAGDHPMAECPLIRAEYADSGLALYALGPKLGLDLIECMRELVDRDQRRFA